MQDDDAPGPEPDLAALADDWIAHWEAALAAAARDPQAQEMWRLFCLAAIAHLDANHVGPVGPNGTIGDHAPAWAAALRAASGSSDATIDRLSQRVATLEARLEALEDGYRKQR